jgi:hypothetical protein
LVHGKNGKLGRLTSHGGSETRSLGVTVGRVRGVVLQVSSVEGHVTHDRKIIGLFENVDSIEDLQNLVGDGGRSVL